MKNGRKALSESYTFVAKVSKTPFSQGKRSSISPKYHVSKHDGSSSEVSDSEDNNKGSIEGAREEASERDDDELHVIATDEETSPKVDEPRLAQWEADEELEILSDRDVDEDKGEGSSKIKFNAVKDDISSWSFGSLLRARRVLDQARAENSSNDSDNESLGSNSDGSVPIEVVERRTMHERTQGSKRTEKRAHKHAPAETTSKRAVTRRRQVVEVKKVNERDPRFSSLTGEFSPIIFQKRYSFLADMHKTELSTLKKNLKRARNMVISSPRDQREARENEVQRLERAVKRLESSVNQDKRNIVESVALEKAWKKEQQRRKEGKGDWYMKKTMKKDLLLRARHDNLAETGGRFAVRKAIERRQKKVGQKEKRQRPSFWARPSERDDEFRSKKRQRVD